MNSIGRWDTHKRVSQECGERRGCDIKQVEQSGNIWDNS